MALRYGDVLAMIVVGAFAGGLAGTRVAANVELPTPEPVSYGPAVEAMVASSSGRGESIVAREGLVPVDFDELVAACENCTDFQLGYRLAEREGVSETAECDDYVWSYEAGCLAYLRASRS